jgi:hypothetical protein
LIDVLGAISLPEEPMFFFGLFFTKRGT